MSIWSLRVWRESDLGVKFGDVCVWMGVVVGALKWTSVSQDKVVVRMGMNDINLCTCSVYMHYSACVGVVHLVQISIYMMMKHGQL